MKRRVTNRIFKYQKTTKILSLYNLSCTHELDKDLTCLQSFGEVVVIF